MEKDPFANLPETAPEGRIEPGSAISQDDVEAMGDVLARIPAAHLAQARG